MQHRRARRRSGRVARALGLVERRARVVDEVALRGLVARGLGLPQRAAGLEDELVGLGPGALQRLATLLAGLLGLPLGLAHDRARVGLGDAGLLERRRELGALPLGLAQRPLERAMEVREARLGLREDVLVEPQPRRDRE